MKANKLAEISIIDSISPTPQILGGVAAVRAGFGRQDALAAVHKGWRAEEYPVYRRERAGRPSRDLSRTRPKDAAAGLNPAANRATTALTHAVGIRRNGDSQLRR